MYCVFWRLYAVVDIENTVRLLLVEMGRVVEDVCVLSCVVGDLCVLLCVVEDVCVLLCIVVY